MSIADILFRIDKESIRAFLLSPAQLQSRSVKTRIRKELLHFHPDKRTQWLKYVKDEERDQVDQVLRADCSPSDRPPEYGYVKINRESGPCSLQQEFKFKILMNSIRAHSPLNPMTFD